MPIQAIVGSLLIGMGGSSTVPNLSSQWQQADIVDALRRRLMDSAGRWWTTAELNQYVEDWQGQLQDTFEFVWSTATTSTTLSTLTLTQVATDVMRLDRVFWNGERLAPKSIQDLFATWPLWEQATASTPVVVYQRDSETFSFWPPPSALGTVVIEYPVQPSFATTTSTMVIPAWTKYSAIAYGCYRAYLRAGPNQDVQRAMRYKKMFKQQLARIQQMKDRYWPDKAPLLRPGGSYEGKIANPTAPPAVGGYY